MSDELLIAAGHGNTTRVRELLDLGGNSNWVDRRVGNSALYNATYLDHVPVIRILLEHGADPNLRLNYHSQVDGRKERNVVALMFAMSREATNELIKAGANVNVTDDANITPLIRAAHRGKVEVVETLLQSGADPRHTTNDGRSARDIVRARIADFRSSDVGENSAIIAERVAKFERILALLQVE